jgi:hypothetical protein
MLVIEIMFTYWNTTDSLRNTYILQCSIFSRLITSLIILSISTMFFSLKCLSIVITIVLFVESRSVNRIFTVLYIFHHSVFALIKDKTFMSHLLISYYQISFYSYLQYCICDSFHNTANNANDNTIYKSKIWTPP